MILYLGPLMPCFLKWVWILRGTHISERVSFKMQKSSKRIRIRRRERHGEILNPNRRDQSNGQKRERERERDQKEGLKC